MSTDRETTRLVRSWLEEGVTELPDRVLDAVLDQVPATSQRRSWWPSRRFSLMNSYAKLAMTAAAVVVVAIVGYSLLPKTGDFGGHPTTAPTPTASAVPAPTPAAFHNGALAAGTYLMTPFAGMANASTVCMPADSTCTENPADDSIRLRSGLYSDPCNSTAPPDIAVGPSVDDFANAIAAHPLLDATTPVDVTLAGYAGKYLDLQLPADVARCTPDGEFWPYEPGVYAQGASHRWHLWILDVEGIRVVVQSMDYAKTSPQRQAELRAIVDSIQITP
jgi:hypothetical protein